jgi:hypothetical protein
MMMFVNHWMPLLMDKPHVNVIVIVNKIALELQLCRRSSGLAAVFFLSVVVVLSFAIHHALGLSLVEVTLHFFTLRVVTLLL